MADNIVVNIVIAGRKYDLKASSPEKEEIIRKAADVVNKKINYYQSAIAGRSLEEILSFVALNECITNLSDARKAEAVSKEIESLEAQLGDYIDKIDKSRQ